MASIKDIAKTAGVSPTTVSRVLNDTPGFTFSVGTRRRIIEIAEQVNYRPSPVARALVRRQSGVVAVAIRDPDDPHFDRPLRRAYEMISARDLSTTLVMPSSVLSLGKVLQLGQADIGLVAGGSLDTCDELIDYLVAPHQIVVGVGYTPRDNGTLPTQVRTAYWDEHESFREALGHLGELGHRNVTYLEGYGDTGKARLVRNEAERIGLEFQSVALAEPGPPLQQGADMARRAMQLHPRPTALFARNDEFALGAIHAIYEAGLSVPEDISVMGYSDIPFAAFANPPLTTIQTPFTKCVEDVLQAAFNALEAGSREALEPQNVCFPSCLVHRRSTAPPN